MLLIRQYRYQKEKYTFSKVINYAKTFQTPLKGTIQAEMKCVSIRVLLRM